MFTQLTPFFQINFNLTHQVALKRVKNCNCQRIYNKNAYVQRSDFTPALKFYPSSARLARYIFHVWYRVFRDLILKRLYKGVQSWLDVYSDPRL